MPFCSSCGCQAPDGSVFCPNCGARLVSSNVEQNYGVVDLSKSFEKELGISEKDASELNSRFQLVMINPPCPFCGAPFSEPLESGEKVTCPHCRNCFVVEDSASKAIGDIMKENKELSEQTVQKAQTIVRKHMTSSRMIHRRRLLEVVSLFRQRGATCPEKVLTPEELGLPLAFRKAMTRRLGRTGLFIEVNGR